jgi:geranylgeranyl pyrophosphate synthase
LGAVTATDDMTYADALANYGFNIGLAFQIVDDILDVIGDEKKLGKTAGIDLEQGRGYAAAYAKEIDSSDPMEAIKRKVMSGEVLSEARSRARMLVESGIAHLDVLPESEAKTALIDLAYQVVERDF